MSLWTNFVRESNHIEGIDRDPTVEELAAHEHLSSLRQIRIADMSELVSILQPNARLRDSEGFDVRVGNHTPMPGGPNVRTMLCGILADANEIDDNPYGLHQRYERLHPFTDGNGRSGRALWAWAMLKAGANQWVFDLGFLHSWYYQSLRAPWPKR